MNSDCVGLDLQGLYARLDCKTTVEVHLGFAVQVFSCTNQNYSNPTTGELTRVELTRVVVVEGTHPTTHPVSYSPQEDSELP